MNNEIITNFDDTIKKRGRKKVKKLNQKKLYLQ